MSFNRNKILTKAQKLLQKGKIAEAIVEYEEIIRNDPTDIRTLLKIGDLHAKVGSIEAATSTYQKVGEFYAKDGFFLKAVAVFKQILKLDPGLILVYLRLAELYQNLGLSSDAIKQFQVVARHYESQGLMKDSLDVLQKISDLEPENFVNRVKLAELYCREGHKDEGKKQFMAILANLEARKNYPELVRVYEKLVALDLQEDDVELKLVDAYLHNAEPKKALIRLQKLFQKNPRDLSILSHLAQCFIDLGQPEKSKSVYLEILNILEKENRTSEKDAFVAKLRALNVMAGDTATHAVDTRSEPTSAAPVASKSLEKVLEETDMYVQYGLIEKALDLLRDAIIESPVEREIRVKFFTVTPAMDPLKVSGTLQAILASSKVQESAEAYEELLRYSQEVIAKARPDNASEPAPEPVSDMMELSLPDEDFSNNSIEFERPSLDVGAIEGFQDPPPPSPVPEGVSSGDSAGDEFGDFSLDFNDDPQIAKSMERVLEEPSSESPEPSVEEEPPAVQIQPAFSPQDSISVELEHQYEAPSVAFGQGVESAEPSLEISVEAQAPSLDEPIVEFSLSEPDPIVSETPAPNADDLLRQAQAALDSGDLGLAKELYVSVLVLDRTRQEAVVGLTKCVASPVPPPKTAEPPPRAEAPASKGAAQSASDLFDLSLELRDEIHDLESQLSKPKSPDEAYLSPEEVISEFKKGVARTVAKDDYQTHYNLGIAYKEMGLLDEAIHEFSIADQDASLHIHAVSMIGLCMSGKRDYAQAIALYRKTLQELPPVMSPQVLGLSYELAEACMGGGYVAEAYKLFSKVAQFDADFRDAKRRAAELKAEFPDAQDDGKVSSFEKMQKKNKVSYI